MNIVYTAPNRAHHYPLAEALSRKGVLHAFISGFSRFSPRSSLPAIGPKLKRHDFFQNLLIGALTLKAPFSITSRLAGVSGARMDAASFRWARESDFFIYYRTHGRNTTLKLRESKSKTMCIMEEVNCHVLVYESLMMQEFKRLRLGTYSNDLFDRELRLKAYDEADAILCPSKFVRQSFISQGVPEDRLISLSYGFPQFEISDGRPEVGEKKTFRVLYVGQINYRKGLRYAIDAFSKLKHSNKELIIVGYGTKTTGLEGMQIPDGVKFTGVLKGEALNDQYRRATVFVLPSIEDGYGLVVGEALSFGVPVVTTSNTGASDVIDDGLNGFIVPHADAVAIAQRFQQMADDPDLLARMSHAALQTAKTLGSWDDAAGRLIDDLKKHLR